MRLIPLLIAVLALSACDSLPEDLFADKSSPNASAPLSVREQALIYGAEGAYAQGNYAAAERNYLAAIEASSGRVDAHLALARLYEKQRQNDKKRDVLNRALALQPDNPVVNYYMGKLYLETNQYSDALDTFRKGRVAQPANTDLAMGEAITLDMMGKHSDAQAIYQAILRDSPDTKLANLNTNLAMSYLLGGDAEKAIDLLRHDPKMIETSPVARHNLALAYGMLGRHTDAKALLKGEMTEDARLLAVTRMRDYWRDRTSARPIATPPPIPSITNQNSVIKNQSEKKPPPPGPKPAKKKKKKSKKTKP